MDVLSVQKHSADTVRSIKYPRMDRYELPLSLVSHCNWHFSSRSNLLETRRVLFSLRIQNEIYATKCCEYNTFAITLISTKIIPHLWIHCSDLCLWVTVEHLVSLRLWGMCFLLLWVWRRHLRFRGASWDDLSVWLEPLFLLSSEPKEQDRNSIFCKYLRWPVTTSRGHYPLFQTWTMDFKIILWYHWYPWDLCSRCFRLHKIMHIRMYRWWCIHPGFKNYWQSPKEMYQWQHKMVLKPIGGVIPSLKQNYQCPTKHFKTHVQG